MAEPRAGRPQHLLPGGPVPGEGEGRRADHREHRHRPQPRHLQPGPDPTQAGHSDTARTTGDRTRPNTPRKIFLGFKNILVENVKVRSVYICLQALIEREWVQAGHPFWTRHAAAGAGGEQAPVFLLFLDCVMQVCVIVCVCVYVCVYMCVCMYIYVGKCVCVCMCVSVYVCETH